MHFSQNTLMDHFTFNQEQLHSNMAQIEELVFKDDIEIG
jgi:hypothetical protein